MARRPRRREDDRRDQPRDRRTRGRLRVHGRGGRAARATRRRRVISRGDLWWADLGLPRGSAPALRRPVLVVSADAYNRSSLRTVTVVVLTTNVQLAALPGN